MLALLLVATISAAQPISKTQIDTLVERTLQTFEVPGIALAIVKDGQIVYEKGYGVISSKTRIKTDAHTRFGIASNTKAFTTTALGILVDGGKINWDDKVRDYIPEFKLYNPYVTEDFTIRDLLTHRSGLGLGSGDLMFFPGATRFTLKDIIYNLRYLKQVSGFRSKFDYDNLLYIVAGEIVARVSKMSWEDFIQNNIFKPLEMTESAPNYDRLKDKYNVIDPHAPVNGKVQVIDRDWKNESDAAGGIYSSVHDMAKWAVMQMDGGKYGADIKKHLIAENTHETMWSPQTILPVYGPGDYNTHFSSYGLGWFLSDQQGYKVVEHTGGLAGIVTQVTLIPELKLGILVFTNQQSGEAFEAITNTIKDSYFGIRGKDRIKEYAQQASNQNAYGKSITDKLWADIRQTQQDNKEKMGARKSDSIYMGTYKDPWFGQVIISQKDGKLWFDAVKSPRLTGEMLAYKGNTFVVKWIDRSMDADAFVLFDLNETGMAAGFSMKAISPLTDFSYDFQDLSFKRKR